MKVDLPSGLTKLSCPVLTVETTESIPGLSAMARSSSVTRRSAAGVSAPFGVWTRATTPGPSWAPVAASMRSVALSEPELGG